MSLTNKEKKELAKLKDELISKVDNPALRIFKGCVKRGSDPGQVARLKELRAKNA